MIFYILKEKIDINIYLIYNYNYNNKFLKKNYKSIENYYSNFQKLIN